MMRVRWGVWVAAAVMALAMAGCDSIDNVDGIPPSAPDGVYSVTGDRQVDIYWNANDERDLAGYRVYRSGNASTGFVRIASVGLNAFTDRDVNNGDKYYYRVSAYDDAGHESDLSDAIRDTPRPGGTVTLFAADGTSPSKSAFDFRHASRASWDCSCADVYLETAGSSLALVIPAGMNAQIQDAGYSTSQPPISKADWAPDGGWSPSGAAEVIPGHVYIIWTVDNHFAALYAVSSSPQTGQATFDWAYQLDDGNPELIARFGAKPATGRNIQ